jgi:hypothetical protein
LSLKQRIIQIMKRKHKSNRLDLVLNVIVGVFGISILFLIKENFLRVIALELILLLWVILTKVSKSSVKSSILILLFVLPLNITFNLSQLVDPYVRGVYVNYLSPTLSVLDLSISILFISLFFASLRKERFLFTLKKIPIWLSLVIFGLLIHLVTHTSLLTLIEVARLSLYLSTAYLLIKESKNIFTASFIKSLLIVILISISIQVVIAFLQTLHGVDLGLQFLGESEILSGSIGSSFINLDSGVILRGYGTFPHPNLLAGYMLITFLTSLYLIPKGALRVAILLLSILGLLLAFSRVAWLLLILLLLIYVIWRVLRERRRYSLSILPISFLERVSSLFTVGESSGRDRLELLKHSFEVIKDNWLLGVGSGNYVSTMKEVVVYTSSGLLLLQPVHNIFVLLFAQYGVLGVFFSFGILYKVIVFNLKRGNLPFYISILLFVILVGITDHYLITLPQGIVMLVILLLL